MKITHLSIENFRLFENLQIDLHPQINVFIGLNGAGKTAILDAIAAAFVPLVSDLLRVPTFRRDRVGITITSTDIRIGSEQTLVRVSVEDEIWGVGVLITEMELWQKVTTSRQVAEKRLRNNLQRKEFSDDAVTSKLKKNPKTNLPLIVYYPTNRIYFDESLKRRGSRLGIYKYNQLHAYDNGLNTGLSTFDDFVQWFEEEEGYEDKMRLGMDNNYRNPKLQTIRQAIELFLAAFGTNKGTFKNIRIKRERNERGDLTNALIISKDGTDLQLSQLSSGEKMMLMLVADIAKRLTIANPSLDNPLTGRGVVLIDEIDLHLHPQWQREIIPALSGTFPNCQFIITTHSPQTISKVKKKCIFIIEGNEIIHNPPSPYGKDSNSILSEIFGVSERPLEVQEKLERCYQYIDSEDFEAAKTLFAELSSILGETDSEITKIETLLTFYADEIN